MRLYARVAALGFRRQTVYWGATWAGAFTNTVFGFLRAYVFVAVFRARQRVGGFDLTDALTYTFYTQGMIMLINLWDLGEIPSRIRSGDIVVDLYRPIDLQAYNLSMDLGRAAYQAVFRGIPPFLVGAVAFHLRVPHSAGTWVLALASCGLATVASFGLRFVMGLSAFWLMDERGVTRLYGAATTFLSGFVIPIAFFPSGVRTIASATPFAMLVELPIEVFLGKRGASALAVQAAWVVVLLAAGRVVLRAATRRLVTQGG